MDETILKNLKERKLLFWNDDMDMQGKKVFWIMYCVWLCRVPLFGERRRLWLFLVYGRLPLHLHWPCQDDAGSPRKRRWAQEPFFWTRGETNQSICTQFKLHVCQRSPPVKPRSINQCQSVNCQTANRLIRTPNTQVKTINESVFPTCSARPCGSSCLTNICLTSESWMKEN